MALGKLEVYAAAKFLDLVVSLFLVVGVFFFDDGLLCFCIALTELHFGL